MKGDKMLIIFVVLLAALIFGLLLLRNSSLTLRAASLIVLLIILIGGSLFYFNIMSIPIGIRHLVNLSLSPKDLYQPIALDTFEFYSVGYTKKYKLDPKYSDIYELGIVACDTGIPASFRFKGKLKVIFEADGKYLFERIITNQQRAIYLKSDMNKYRMVTLTDFEIPLLGKYRKDIYMTLVVIEPDLGIEKYRDCIKLYIAVSASP
jgi:hypothetical protein